MSLPFVEDLFEPAHISFKITVLVSKSFDKHIQLLWSQLNPEYLQLSYEGICGHGIRFELVVDVKTVPAEVFKHLHQQPPLSLAQVHFLKRQIGYILTQFFNFVRILVKFFVNLEFVNVLTQLNIINLNITNAVVV